MNARILALALSTTLALAAPALVAAPSAERDLLIVLDASGSMWGQIQGVNKIVIARQVIKEQLLPKIPEGTQVGLVAYGHRSESDCADIETVVPMGPLDKAAMTKVVDAIQPKGKTPITASLQEALRLLKGRSAPATILLLTDGLETCNADPCATVREAKKAGAEFVLHIVGFDLGAEEVSTLECTAQAGDGLYFDAGNAEELAAALNEAVAAPVEIPEGRLSVKGVENGKLHDVLVRVVDPKTGKDVASGRTYESPATNPRILALPPGTYRVLAKSIKLKGNVERVFEDVAVAGEVVEKTVDFSSGTIVIGVTRNGALSDGLVTIYESGTKKRVGGGRTYTDSKHNPASYSVTVGTFDVVVESIEIAGKPSETLKSIEVSGQGSVERSVAFQSADLKVGATRGAALVDAVVSVVDAASGTSIDQGRTYKDAKSNPVTFTLLPGSYKVSVKPVGGAKDPAKEIRVTLAAGETQEQAADFGP